MEALEALEEWEDSEEMEALVSLAQLALLLTSRRFTHLSCSNCKEWASPMRVLISKR